jgi:hypothetical protein
LGCRALARGGLDGDLVFWVGVGLLVALVLVEAGPPGVVGEGRLRLDDNLERWLPGLVSGAAANTKQANSW